MSSAIIEYRKTKMSNFAEIRHLFFFGKFFVIVGGIRYEIIQS
ncbi:hypothetical protein RUMCAL_01044 [Ruminococcus callidus ATCC 27760]|uniref:Uncharacterized protein n=1 Tax=Ruminococcus callidus ATCC 27760 TaxID=411473 RepID=U2MBB7_9FIRM|nr:hypothetical protein RUMCAL_01044 [Ruminococcus callidus ATCC 27760]